MVNGKRSALMLTAIIGIILVIMTMLPVGRALLMGLGIFFVNPTAKTYQEIINAVDTVQPNEMRTMIASIDDGTAIIGFSSDSDFIQVIRAGFDFKFYKPEQCGSRACICMCKQMDHDTAMGSDAYFCKEPKPGDPDDYMICNNELGAELIGFISKDRFSGDANFANYGIRGGFIIARATTAWGLADSRVFNMPKNPVVVVQKSGTEVNGMNIVSVCLNQNGCLEEENVEDQVNRMLARTLFYDAKREYEKNTPESRQKARELFAELIANQAYMDQLALITEGGNDPSYYLHDYSYMYAAYNEVRDNNYDKALEYLQLAVNNVIHEQTKEQAIKDIERFTERMQEQQEQEEQGPPVS
ncbi:hypothetical protein GF345_06635 [Candidatus Woesearchaeota archaeon]|nr:hypothetical protein [Candidatus Woesearchaeota archaeon]